MDNSRNKQKYIFFNDSWPRLTGLGFLKKADRGLVGKIPICFVPVEA